MNALRMDAVTAPIDSLVHELLPPPDPWALAQSLADRPHLLFFDSARTGALGRYSFVCADPYLWLTDEPLAQLERHLGPRQPSLPHLPPFQGGMAGLWGYDLCHQLERVPRAGQDEFRVPALGVGLYDVVIAWDHAQDRAWIVSTGMPENGSARRNRAADRLREILAWLRRPAVVPRAVGSGGTIEPACFHPLPGGRPGVGSSFTPQGFRDAIRAGIEYVHAGDCFQVNLSQRLLAPLHEHPLELYGRLRKVNPAPFAGYLDLGDQAVISASPERFLRLHEGKVVTRPIKGTRPRGSTPEEDARIARELQDSPKDRAENVMIVDLLRNDLGRVCRFGSVRVESLCRLESYPTVHHLVSEVVGTLLPGRGPMDLLRAAFPGGSITGAPKVRAMEIIAELEPTVRGPYCGSLGYIGLDGTMDTSILIRTFTAAGGWVQFPVGGGIVADSDPDAEYQETLTKAAGLLRALPD
jgi:para-aminobenzoate synthetase component 1